MACTLLDACGLFMYRSAESHQRCKIYLEQMMRKKVKIIKNECLKLNSPPIVAFPTKKQKKILIRLKLINVCISAKPVKN